MKKPIFILALAALIFNASCKDDKKETEVVIEPEVTEQKQATTQETKKLQINLESKSNSEVTGKAIFMEEQGVVTMTAVIKGLSGGKHAIHLHEKADCSADDGTSSGGHWNPTGEPHGEWGSEKGYHKGDIGNIEANVNGTATLTFTTDQWCIGCDDPNKDILGKAIIIHEDHDDFETQPTGNAGGRVSCGGIIQ